jgi:hypothetical protein
LRAQLLQDVVQMGETEDWSQKPEAERPRCAILSQAAVGARGTDTLVANDGRGSGQADTHVWDLPCLWGGLFSPSMKS